MKYNDKMESLKDWEDTIDINRKPIQYQIGIDTIANEVFYSDGKLFWKEFKNGRRKNLLAGNTRKDGYLTICINKKSFLQHRVVWYIFNGPIPDGYEIGHIDRNPRNNKIDNLRLVSSQENKFNSYAKGYTWNKDKNKWTASIWLNRKRIHLGHFNNEEDARKAYIDAKNKLHGDLNYE